MTAEGTRSQLQEVFVQHPEFERAYNETSRTIADTIPTSYQAPEMATRSVGIIVLHQADRLGRVEPLKSNWEDHVDHWRIIRAQFRGEPNPFASWDDYLSEVSGSWIRHDGLADSTIVPVIKEVMSTVGLWTDAGIRHLVLASLVDRGQLQFTGMDELRAHFMQLSPRGFMETKEEATMLINYLADNAAEMDSKRPFGFARSISTERNPSNTKGLFPKGFVFMNNEAWDEFMKTPIGRRLGLFSTVSWFTQKDGAEKEDPTDYDKSLMKIRDFCAGALQHYVDTP